MSNIKALYKNKSNKTKEYLNHQCYALITVRLVYEAKLVMLLMFVGSLHNCMNDKFFVTSLYLLVTATLKLI